MPGWQSVPHQFQVRAWSKPCLISSQGVTIKGAVVRGGYGGGCSREPLTGGYKALQQVAGGSRAYGLDGMLPMRQTAGALAMFAWAAAASDAAGACWCFNDKTRGQTGKDAQEGSNR